MAPEAATQYRLDDSRLSRRVNVFPESVIREMTRLALKHDAINIAQGFPDWNPPQEIIDAAKEALDGPNNQYAMTWGAPVLRQAISEYNQATWGLPSDPDKNVTVTCGSTEAMMAAMLALINDGDEVAIFEPFYENYGPDAALSGAKLRHVSLYPEDAYRFDEEELKAAFNPNTKAIIVNTPNNPSGKVFDRDELRVIADLCIDHDVVAVTDEIYDYLVFDGHEHIPLATLEGMEDRTITIQGASKVYSATGWRVAWATAGDVLTEAVRRVHDFLTVGAAHPLQVAIASALKLPQSYYDQLHARYVQNRDELLSILNEAGFNAPTPDGTYYTMADFTDFPAPVEAKADDFTFNRWLMENKGVLGVPGTSFFHTEGLGKNLLRFHFAKNPDQLELVRQRLLG